MTTTAAAPVRAPRRKKQPPAFEQFFAIRRFQPTLAFTPDGRNLLFSSDISGQFNLWKVKRTGGWPQQLTSFADQSVREVSVSPDGKTIVFTADRDGDEFHQIYALPIKGGWPEPWTDAPQAQHYLGRWSPDGTKLAYCANSRVPQDQDILVRDLASGESTMVLGGDKYAFPGGWSPDGRQLAAVDVRGNTDMSIHLIDTVEGETRELTPHDPEDEAIYFPGPWAADGSGFYVLSNEGREYVGLAFWDLDAARLEWIDTPDHEIDLPELTGSQDGRMLAWLVNEDGWSRLRIRNLETGTDAPEPQLPQGTHSPFGSGLTLSSDGRYAALVWTSPQQPPELWLVETETGKAKRLSDSMVGGLGERDLAAPELISYPTFDGKQIPAWLYRPKKKGKTPVVVSIHGGPESQELPIYNGLYQYLVSRGIAVLATNIRGSTGYGKTYQTLIHRDWGGADLKDWEHAVKWLHAQDWADRDRIGVFGGSYGGFACLTCVTRLPDLWAAAVDIVGPSNLVSFSKAVPPQWRRFMDKWVGNPETEADFLMERSPITYVENVRAPLLVIQGAKDPRVVKPESDQMVAKLRELGRTVEYEVFEDEGHGFTKKENQLRGFRLTADWLERHLTA